ncbi:MAG: NAD(P)/FAD-dependent oxidoreductase [Chromatocurvus sp.]
MHRGGITRRKAITTLGALAVGTGIAPRVLSASAGGSREVLVLGAGIGGLHAAMALEADGFNVTVVEGSGRVGGRCWTSPSGAELGASQISSAYTRVVGHCKRLGLELIPPGSYLPDHVKIPGAAISLGGRAAPKVPWEESPQNILKGSERDVLPMQLISHYCDGVNPLTSMTDWLDPRHAALDALPLSEFMRQQGASHEALRLADAFSPAHRLDDISTLDIMRKEFAYRWYAKQGPYFHVASGTGALTDAMAASLSKPVELNRRVSAIHTAKSGVTVDCSDGTRYQASAAVCTLPTSTLRKITFDPHATEEHRAAWDNLAYAKATLVYLEAKESFWEADGLPPALWSDVAPEYAVLVKTFPGGGGLIMCHINGEASERYRNWTAQEVGRDIMNAYISARPSAAGLISVSSIHDWTTYPYSLGHIAYFRPGDIGRHALQLAAPVGPLYFAGEHCGRAAIGVEAACESAQVAVDNIRLRLG